MKRFLLHTSILIALCFISFLIVLLLANGTTDAMYAKFTTPKQNSLIIGSSRAAQGIQPKIINALIPNKDLYNYAFSIPASPYGEAYYNSIKKKVNLKVKNGLFLVCVNPWTISSVFQNPEDVLNCREQHSFIDKTSFVNLKPNIEYLSESFEGKYKDIIGNRFRRGEYQTFYVHDDGWLEVSIESNMISRVERTKNKMEAYKKKLKQYSGISKTRVLFLKKTIQFLKSHGDVYIVRLPVSDEMLLIENQLVSNFDERMLQISQELQINYLNMMPFRQNYFFTDGNHLDIASGKAFSKYLAEQINELRE